MPINLADLVKDLRHTTFEWNEESMEVVYRPSMYTPMLEQEMQESVGARQPGIGLARLLSEILVSWELLDNEQNVIPTTFEEISRISMGFLTALVNHINVDMREDRDDVKNSGAGSQARRKSGKSLSGTR